MVTKHEQLLLWRGADLGLEVFWRPENLIRAWMASWMCHSY